MKQLSFKMKIVIFEIVFGTVHIDNHTKDCKNSFIYQFQPITHH